ncbi:hypothetical protein K0M31_006335 [Melipona bicolor]|uniref:Uncharacterized protein n=1 Tax=Melipona bicolor TaxID=60889 RepID=A0AA40FTK7_9HYME|nr:hypothetical protein K0M31_006335 [Melipona bicolor]
MPGFDATISIRLTNFSVISRRRDKRNSRTARSNTRRGKKDANACDGEEGLGVGGLGVRNGRRRCLVARGSVSNPAYKNFCTKLVEKERERERE